MFYRYGSRLDYLEPVIREHRIYVPLPSELNDPREARPRWENRDAKEIAAYLKLKFRVVNPNFDAERYAQADADIDEGVAAAGVEYLRTSAMNKLYERLDRRRILSLSKQWNNLPLWAHYANNHRGYCLEFANAGEFASAREVLYTETFRFDICNESPENADLYLHKTPEWNYEEEVRRVFPRTLVGPYVPIQPEWFTRIILGKNMSEVDRQRIETWAAQRVPRLTVMVARWDSEMQELTLLPAT